MLFAALPHILGIACMLYALQLVRELRLDLAGKGFSTGLMAVAAGCVALVLALILVMAVDYCYPVGSMESHATFFVRVAFLIPAMYLAAFVCASLMGRIIGARYSSAIVMHTAFLGVTLIVLAPIALRWLADLSPVISE